MKFTHTILYVKSVERSVSFYEKAFGLKPRFVHESGDYAEMETGDVALAFVALELAKENLPLGFRDPDPKDRAPAIELTFTTDDVAAAYEHAIEAGALRLRPAAEKAWGQTVAYVRDPDGVLIELASPIQ